MHDAVEELYSERVSKFINVQKKVNHLKLKLLSGHN